MVYMMFKQVLFILVSVVLMVPLIRTEDSKEPAICPEGCTCLNAMEAKCKGVAEIPNFLNKSLINSLTIESHNITELNKEHLTDFTSLKQLYINKGVLEKISPGTFEPVKETITILDFSGNAISEIESNVFANLTNINKIVLNANHLTNIKAESFVNLPKLVNLNIVANHLESMDKDAFKDLPELENLDLYNNHLTEIPFESMAKLHSVKEVTLSFNKIKSIPEKPGVFIPTLQDIYLDSNPIAKLGVFPNISNSLQRLDLQFTNISEATKETWKYLPELIHLNIGGTLFQQITAGTFDGLSKLQKVLLRDMRVLNFVGPGAFRGVKKATTIDLANCKKLHTIDESAFISTEVSTIFLRDSGITYIPKNLLKWSKMKTVSIGGNPINCDCKVAWMLNASNFGNNTEVRNSFNKLVCATPKEHYGKDVTSLHPINLTCKPLPDDHVSRFATGIIIAVICFVFMTTFALIMKYRKRIMISCHRYYQYRRYKNDMVFTVEHDTSIAELEDTDGSEGRPLKDMRLETVPLET